MTKPRILCIVGPTACHKTDASILLAHALDAEIVSADSVQVYKGMDIGSAKPTLLEREGIPHHMIDCMPIDTPSFSVSLFRKLACEAIDGILSRNTLPIIVGGSGLYVNAITNPLNFAVPSDAAIRKALSDAYDLSPEDVYNSLRQCDPQTAERLHIHDKKRIVRALEVYQCSGKPLSAYGNDFSNSAHSESAYDAAFLGLTMDRDQLHTRIAQRVDMMMQRGLLQEAEAIYAAGYVRSLPAMQSIGYQQLFRYFDGELTLPDAVELIKRDTRRFARRQLTWFRRDTRIHWIDVTQFHENEKRTILTTAKELIQK